MYNGRQSPVSSNLFVEALVTLNHVRCAPLMFCAAIFLAAPLFPHELFAHQETTPVTAVVLTDAPYSNLAIREMGREAARILKQSGVSLHWRVGASAQPVSGLLVVVKLQGHCDMDGSPALAVSGPLGWTHEVDGKMLPFTDLACDKLRGVIEASRHDQSRGNALLGRAMGRVLAHELYHITADTSQHGRDGVAQAALTPSELTSGSLDLRASEVAAVENGLSRGR